MYPKYYLQVRINLPCVVWRVLISLSKMLGDSACKSLALKKWLTVFPSPAGMSLTKLSLAGNNLNILLTFFTVHTDKKENQISFLYKEIQNGAVAKSYMTNGLLIYGEIFAHFLIYMSLQLLHSELPYIQ